MIQRNTPQSAFGPVPGLALKIPAAALCRPRDLSAPGSLEPAKTVLQMKDVDHPFGPVKLFPERRKPVQAAAGWILGPIDRSYAGG